MLFLRNRNRWLRLIGVAVPTLATIQVAAWFGWGRHNLPAKVPVVVGRDLVYFRQFLRSYWPLEAGRPPFASLVVVPGSLPSGSTEAIERILASRGIRMAFSPETPGPGTAQVFSFAVTRNTPMVGTIVSSYSAGGVGLSMRTRFIFVLGAWLPLSTTQRAIS